MANYLDGDALSAPLDSLYLKIGTVHANDASSGDTVYVNVVFADGTRLYEPTNHAIGSPPDPGKEEWFELPIPGGLERTLADVAELYLRKSGNDGWFLGSALLFRKKTDLPFIGSRHAHQFLDNDKKVLGLRDWSTRSICVAQATKAKHPLCAAGYRVLGPVIGQVSDTSAVVLYRVDREGSYRFRATDPVTALVVADETLDVEPVRRFELTGLEAGKRYDFELFFVHAGVETPVADAAGSLTTYPKEGLPGRFSFAFGSCANPRMQAAQGSWTAIRSLAESPPHGIEPVSLFVHLGDSFYFHDDVTDQRPRNLATLHAAHISMRRHLEFLDMARVVPCCGIWDDHDFAGDDTYRNDLAPALRKPVVEIWRQYWGNAQSISRGSDHGLTTRISHGLVDIYLLDGRINRDPDTGVCFGSELIADLVHTIQQRGAIQPRVVVLATGSNWNHLPVDDEDYGKSTYDTERKLLYGCLANLMGKEINGLILLSGDDHVNEIFHVRLEGDWFAPEFMASPLTKNSDPNPSSRPIHGERVKSFKDKRGFCTLTIDTPEENRQVTATVRYYQEAGAIPYHEGTYAVVNGQFKLV